MKKFKMLCFCIVIGFSLFGVMGSVVFIVFRTSSSELETISTIFGIVGTVASVVLSIMAMLYSNKASKDAEESLKKIMDRYETLCREIASKEIYKSVGKSSIERIIHENQSNHED